MVKRLKIFALILALLMVYSILAAGCAKNTKEETPAASGTTAATTEGTTGGTNEAVKPTDFEKKLELTWLIAYDASAYKEGTQVEKTLEEKFNVDLKVVPINAMDNEKFNVTIASGTIPDVIIRWDSQKLYTDGVVRSITEDMLMQYMPQTYKAVNELGGLAAWETFKGYTDGKLFAVPQINASGAARLVLGVRQDWMDNLGITSLPTTVDELYALAKAFTFDDPDKNGKKDTYGLGGAGMHPNPMFWQFQTIFGAYGVHPQYWIEEDGKVVFGAIANGYKEALKTLAKWYKDGVIDPEFVTDQNANYANKVSSGVLGMYDGHPTYFDLTNKTMPPAILNDANANAKFVFLNPPKGPQGKSGAISYGVVGSWGMMFSIKATDEKVIRAMQIGEALNTDIDLFTLTFSGINGEHFDKNGDQNVTKQGIVESENGIKVFRTGSYLNMDFVKTFMSKSALDIVLPTTNHPLMRSVTDGGRLTTLNQGKINSADMDKTVKEFYFNAITGKVNIDAEWDKYVEEWTELGGKVLTEEAQKAPRLDK